MIIIANSVYKQQNAHKRSVNLIIYEMNVLVNNLVKTVYVINLILLCRAVLPKVGCREFLNHTKSDTIALPSVFLTNFS